jgi:hypothetical protein
VCKTIFGTLQISPVGHPCIVMCNHNQTFFTTEYIKPATKEIIQVKVFIPKKKFNLKCNVLLIKSTQVRWLYDKVNAMRPRQHYTRSPLNSNHALKTSVPHDHIKFPAWGQVESEFQQEVSLRLSLIFFQKFTLPICFINCRIN